MTNQKLLRSVEGKFWKHIELRDNGCIDWVSYCDPLGYGHFQFRAGGKKYKFRAHRASIQLLTEFDLGPTDVVRHTCDRPSCVNPLHLRIGSHADNCADKVAKDRQAQGEGHGRSKLTTEDVTEIRSSYAAFIARLSLLFGIDPTAIKNVCAVKTWRSI